MFTETVEELIMVKRVDLEKWLNDYLNVSQVNDWLPNGLQIEGREGIEKIVTAVSINMDVIKSAVDEKADALIVHHGMFWQKEEQRIINYRKSRIKLLLEHDINLFAYHLPLDYHPEISHNRLILEGISATKIVNQASLPRELDVGLAGYFEPPLPIDQLLKRIEDFFKSKPGVFLFGEKDIHSIFVVSGAGRNLTDKVAFAGFDTYLTGDVSETIPAIAKETKLNYIYCGHYNTEKPGIIALGQKIKENFDVDVRFVDVPNSL